MPGKKETLFKPFLFADQDLDELASDIAPRQGALAEAVGHLRAGNPGEAEVVLASAILTNPGEVGPWHRLVLAMAQVRVGKSAAAIRTLRSLGDSTQESRIRLWTWQALRRLGVEPAPEVARRVEGVVIEVDGGHGVETLAAYADGRARYLLPTGAKVIWDAPDGRLERAVADVVAGGALVIEATTPGRLPGEPAPGAARMTLLTGAGPRAAEEPLVDAAKDDGPRAALFGPATRLMQAIVAIAKW